MNDDKPFECSIPGCGMKFTNEDHLGVHKTKHQLSLHLAPDEMRGVLGFVDQTPTPSKFLKSWEEGSFLHEISTKNPFEEAFKRAIEGTTDINASTTTTSPHPLQADTLNTPNPFNFLHDHAFTNGTKHPIMYESSNTEYSTSETYNNNIEKTISCSAGTNNQKMVEGGDDKDCMEDCGEHNGEELLQKGNATNSYRGIANQDEVRLLIQLNGQDISSEEVVVGVNDINSGIHNYNNNNKHDDHNKGQANNDKSNSFDQQYSISCSSLDRNVGLDSTTPAYIMLNNTIIPIHLPPFTNSKNLDPAHHHTNTTTTSNSEDDHTGHQSVQAKAFAGIKLGDCSSNKAQLSNARSLRTIMPSMVKDARKTSFKINKGITLTTKQKLKAAIQQQRHTIQPSFSKPVPNQHTTQLPDNMKVMAEAVDLITQQEQQNSVRNNGGFSAEPDSDVVSENCKETHNEVVERRRKSLERNRAAAARCRQKKKFQMNRLSQQITHLESTNHTMQLEINKLKAELDRVNSILLVYKQQHHNNCIESVDNNNDDKNNNNKNNDNNNNNNENINFNSVFNDNDLTNNLSYENDNINNKNNNSYNNKNHNTNNNNTIMDEKGRTAGCYKENLIREMHPDINNDNFASFSFIISPLSEASNGNDVIDNNNNVNNPSNNVSNNINNDNDFDNNNNNNINNNNVRDDVFEVNNKNNNIVNVCVNEENENTNYNNNVNNNNNNVNNNNKLT